VFAFLIKIEIIVRNTESLMVILAMEPCKEIVPLKCNHMSVLKILDKPVITTPVLFWRHAYRQVIWERIFKDLSERGP